VFKRVWQELRLASPWRSRAMASSSVVTDT
jgi:hypothetical protein